MGTREVLRQPLLCLPQPLQLLPSQFQIRRCSWLLLHWLRSCLNMERSPRWRLPRSLRRTSSSPSMCKNREMSKSPQKKVKWAYTRNAPLRKLKVLHAILHYIHIFFFLLHNQRIEMKVIPREYVESNKKQGDEMPWKPRGFLSLNREDVGIHRRSYIILH